MDITEIYNLFPTHEDCLKHLEKVRWKGIPVCPYCKSLKTSPMPKEKRHHCNSCNTTFSLTVATIFHHTHLPLQKWFLAICLTLNAKKGVAARQMARHLHVNKDTAWRMNMKIRGAMVEREQRELLTGLVECDETYIGGKPRPGTGFHPRGRGTDKPSVVGMAERVRRNVDIKNAT